MGGICRIEEREAFTNTENNLWLGILVTVNTLIRSLPSYGS